MSTKKKFLIGGLIAIVIAALASIFVQSAANAQGEEPCVPSDAWTETIEHPAVTHVVHHEAVTHVVHHDAVTHTVHIIDVEATPEVWANFSPNHNQGPFEGPPSYPTDERGTWHNHDKIPGGHEGADGVYQRDNPHSGRADWFYRHNATLEISHDEVIVDQEAYDETVVDQEAYDETVVDEEAWTETIEHPAVTCEDDHGNPPSPQVTATSSTSYHCGDNFQPVHEVRTETPYMWDEESESWVLDPANAVVTVKDYTIPHDVQKCPKEIVEHNTHTTNTIVKHVNNTVAVPTSIDAGL